MPPSMLSSEALVIWMFRIAMNAPIMAASTAIHVAVLAWSASRQAGLSGTGEAAGIVMTFDMVVPSGGEPSQLT